MLIDTPLEVTSTAPCTQIGYRSATLGGRIIRDAPYIYIPYSRINSIVGGPFEPARVCVTNVFARPPKQPRHPRHTILMDFNWLFNVYCRLKGAFYQLAAYISGEAYSVFVQPRIRDASRPVKCGPRGRGGGG